jgi:hypothetical protein
MVCPCQVKLSKFKILVNILPQENRDTSKTRLVAHPNISSRHPLLIEYIVDKGADHTTIRYAFGILHSAIYSSKAKL